MGETGTIHDAAAVFSALRGDQVIELLSRLGTEDAQHLLATAAKMTSSTDDLKHACCLLAKELGQPKSRQESRQEKTSSIHSGSATKNRKRSKQRSKQSSKQRSKQSSKQRNGEKSGDHSLDFLITMPAQDIRHLLSMVNTAYWAPVLKTETNEVRDAVFDNVAPAIERILHQEIAAFDGNSQVARMSRKKIIDAANDLQPPASDSTLRKAG